MLIEIFQYYYVLVYFNSSKLMKTSQIKKFMPLQNKPIKLKFENIKNQQTNLKFSTQDLPNINFVYTHIQDTLRNGHSITQDTLRLIFDIVKRVKKTVDQIDAQNNKIRFRVVKSAKKPNNNDYVNPKSTQPHQEFNKSTMTLPILSLSENRAQPSVMENKQNSLYSSNNINTKDNKSQTFSSSYNGKAKFKKIDSKPLQICQITEIKAINNQQRLRTQIKKLEQQIQNKNKKIKDLEESINLLSKKIQDQENFKIDLKFSLKCLDNESADKQNKEQHLNTSQNSQVKKNLNDKNQKYIEQHINHLKLMIVSQNKQIEALYKKLSEGVRDASKKSSRWNSY